MNSTEALTRAMRLLDPHCHGCNLETVIEFTDSNGKLRRMCGGHFNEYRSRQRYTGNADVSMQYRDLMPVGTVPAMADRPHWQEGDLVTFHPPGQGKLSARVKENGSTRDKNFITIKITGGAVNRTWYIGRVYTVWPGEQQYLSDRVVYGV